MPLRITATKLPGYIADIWQAGLVPMIHSSPGMGKSDIVKALAKKHFLKVIDMRLSQMDPTDLKGFPAHNTDHTRSKYLPTEEIPLKGVDLLPKGYKGWVLFLDELNSAPRAVIAATYRLILDREVGKHKIHPKILIIAAGNLKTDKAIVANMGTAMESRLAHFELMLDPEAWTIWATKTGIDHRVISFLSWKSELLHQFDPNHSDHTFPCPRTWEFASKAIKKYPDLAPDQLPLVASVVGEAAASEFMAFITVYATLPSMVQIEGNPEGAPVPDEPSAQYALSGTIGQKMDPQNADNLMKYLVRMGIEFQILAISRALQIHDTKLRVKESVRRWTMVNSREFVDALE